MSQLGTTIHIRGDDKGFKSSLASAENSAETSFKRIGDTAQQHLGRASVDARTQFTRTIAFANSALRGFGAVALFTGVVSAVEQMSNFTDDTYHAAAKELDARTRTLNTLRQQLSALQEISAHQRAIGALSGQYAALDPLKGMVQDAQQRLRQLENEVWQLSPSRWMKELSTIDFGAVSGDGPFLGLKMGTRYQEDLNAATREYQRLLTMLRDAQETITAAIARQSAELQHQLKMRMTQAAISARAQMATAGGDTVEAARIQEQLQHWKNLDEARGFIVDGEVERGRELAALENERHAAVMNRLQQEAEAKQRNADLDEKAQEVERLRLKGDEEGARKLELRIQHRRRLAELEERFFADPAQRARMIGAEQQLFEMRLMKDSGRYITAQAGLGAQATALSLGAMVLMKAGPTPEEQRAANAEARRERRAAEQAAHEKRLESKMDQLISVAKMPAAAVYG